MSVALVLVSEKTRPSADFTSLPPLRGLISVGGIPAEDRILRVLSTFSDLRQLLATTDEAAARRVLRSSSRAKMVVGFSSPIELIRSALQDVPQEEIVLLLSGDLPFLERSEIENLLTRARREKSLFVPIVELGKLPGGVEKRNLAFKEGTYCPGLALAGSRGLLTEALFGKLESVLQSPLAILKQIGSRFLLKMLFVKPYLSEAEKLGSDFLGTELKLIPMPSAGFARNLSSTADLHAAGVP